MATDQHLKGTDATEAPRGSAATEESEEGWEIVTMPTENSPDSQNSNCDTPEPIASTSSLSEVPHTKLDCDQDLIAPLSYNLHLSEDFPDLERKPVTRKSRTRFNKVRLKRKKWLATSDLFSFDYFPNRKVTYLEDDECMQQALEKFEGSLSSLEMEETNTLNENGGPMATSELKETILKQASNENHNEDNGMECKTDLDNDKMKCNTTVENGDGVESVPKDSPVEETQESRKKKKHIKCHNIPDSDVDDADEEFADLDCKMSRNQYKAIERYLYDRCIRGENFRRKSKWHDLKAGRGVKDKNVISVQNNPHGRKLFVHYRNTLANLRYKDRSYTTRVFSSKRIDQKDAVWNNNYAANPARAAPNRVYRPPQQQNRDYPVAVPFAINAQNADNALDRDLVNVLMNMQNRDLTPEDYDLLLRLDERVQPKTLETDVIAGFKVDTAGETDIVEACPVCMDFYKVGDERKHLPCGHYFHTVCIERWLANSSMNCPLDGLAVAPSWCWPVHRLDSYRDCFTFHIPYTCFKEKTQDMEPCFNIKIIFQA